MSKKNSIDFIYDSLRNYVRYDNRNAVEIFDKIFEDARELHKKETIGTLPTDEEIDKHFTQELIFGVYRVDYNKVEGAKWMRDKIQGGNNEQQ